MSTRPFLAIVTALVALSLGGCREHPEAEHHHGASKIVVTSPQIKDVVTTQQYVCQIHSRRHIEVCALVGGYLE